MRTLMQNYRPSRQGDVHGDATGGPSGYATNAFDSPMHSGYTPYAFTCDVGVEAAHTAIDEDNIDDIVTNTEPLAAVIVPIPSRKLRTTRVRQMASQLLSPFLIQPHIRESTIKLNLKAAAKLVFDLEGEASDELVAMHASHLTRGNLGCFEGNGWIGNHVMDVYSRMMQFDDHTHSRLFLTPYIADMIIKTQSNCIKKDVIMRRFVCNLYQMDIQYSSVKEVFVPMLVRNHWTLLIVDLVNMRIQLLDPRSRRKKHQMTTLIQKMTTVALYLVAHKMEVPDFDMKSFNFVMPDIPCQENENDCGVFVMKFMELWSMGGLSKAIDSGKMNKYRLKIMGKMLFSEQNAHKDIFL